MYELIIPTWATFQSAPEGNCVPCLGALRPAPHLGCQDNLVPAAEIPFSIEVACAEQPNHLVELVGSGFGVLAALPHRECDFEEAASYFSLARVRRTPSHCLARITCPSGFARHAQPHSFRKSHESAGPRAFTSRSRKKTIEGLKPSCLRL